MMKIKDERVEQARNKIYGELFQILFLFAMTVFLVKVLYFKMDVSQCITEYVIMIFAPIYQMVRSRQLGVVLATNLQQQMSLKRNILTAVTGIALFFINWLASGRQVTKEFAFWYIATFLVAFFGIRVVFIRFEERRMKKLAEKYEQ